MRPILITCRWKTTEGTVDHVNQFGINSRDASELCIDINGTIIYPKPVVKAKKPTLEELTSRYRNYASNVEGSIRHMLTALEPWLGPGFFDPPSNSTQPGQCPGPAPECTSAPAEAAPPSPQAPESAPQSLADLLNSLKTACPAYLTEATRGNLENALKILLHPEASKMLTRNRTLVDLLELRDRTDDFVRVLLAGLTHGDREKKEPAQKQ